MYKEAYKEKLRKEKEEREKDDIQTKKDNYKNAYGRNTNSHTANTKTTVSTTASSNNGQVSNQNKDLNNKKPIGSNLNNTAMKTQDNLKKDDKQGDKKTNFEDVKNKVVTGNKNNSNLKRDSANTNNQNSIPGSSKQTSSYQNGGRSAMSNGRTLQTKTAPGTNNVERSPNIKVNDMVSGQSNQNDDES